MVAWNWAHFCCAQVGDCLVQLPSHRPLPTYSSNQPTLIKKQYFCMGSAT